MPPTKGGLVPPFFLLLGLLLSSTLAPAPAVSAPPTSASLKNCPDQCGSVSLPYPFGYRRGCYRPGFQVECNGSSREPMIRLPGAEYTRDELFTVTNISLDAVSVQLGVLEYCGPGMQVEGNDDSVSVTVKPGGDGNFSSTELEGSPYTMSYRNSLVVLGCYSIGQLFIGFQPAASCVPSCIDSSDIANGNCSVLSGCCQSIIPKSLKNFNLILNSMNTKNVRGMNETFKQVSNCSYAFVMDAHQYEFRSTDLSDYYGSRGSWSVPAVLDWAIGSYNCSVARTSPDYACGGNATCVNSTNGPGYRCICNNGYAGNPYLADGCQDIDECNDPGLNSCSDNCMNIEGTFKCSCPEGSYGDGKKDGRGCIKDVKKFPILQVILGCGLGFLFLLVSSSWLHRFLKERKLMRLREKFFEENGGLIMRQIILSQHGATQIAKLFTEQELRNATANFSEKKILGQGGFGTVYKGTLQDEIIVAIKKSKIEDKDQIEQFINEIVILSQLNHRNVVKIIGCCLESPVPLLVYDYIPNGTLFYHIHDPDRVSSLSWQARLRIAAETADGIAYLHSFASHPIIHRDIKSSNILLDNNYSAKVSDFGISKIIPLDGSEKSTKIQGTMGYMDPESFETGQLTVQSDVFSFGVVLAELLTGETPLLTKNQANVSLASYFVTFMKDKKLFEILEPRVRDEGNPDDLQKIGNLTRECLSPKGEERPSMKEVAAELTKFRTKLTPIIHPYTEELQGVGFKCSPSTSFSLSPLSTSISSTNTAVQDSTIIWSAYVGH